MSMSINEAFVVWAGGDAMEGKTFAKMCKECKLNDKKYTATDCDLLFTKVKTQAGIKGNKIDFGAFSSALEGIAAKKGVDKSEVMQAIVDSGGPSFAGATKTDAVRFHDDKSTYNGVHLHGGPSTTGDGTVSLSSHLDRSPADVRGVKTTSVKNLSPAPKTTSVRSLGGAASSAVPKTTSTKTLSPAPKTTSVKSLSKPAGDGGLSEGMASLSVTNIKEAFTAWAGGDAMEGKTFAKMCKECKLLDKKYTATDCDLLFTKVKTQAGVKGNKIDFKVFDTALEGIAAKKGCEKSAVSDLIVESGGPSFAGATKTDAVRFHDDKSTYNGVHLHGGPSTTGDGTMSLASHLDRSPADVRGVKTTSSRNLK